MASVPPLVLKIAPSVSRLVRSESRALLQHHQRLMAAVRTPGKAGREALEEEALAIFSRASSILGRLELEAVPQKAKRSVSRQPAYRSPRKGSARDR